MIQKGTVSRCQPLLLGGGKCSWLGLAAGWQQIDLPKAGGLGQRWKDVPNHQPKILPKPRGGNIFNSSPKKAKNICQRFQQYHS